MLAFSHFVLPLTAAFTSAHIPGIASISLQARVLDGRMSESLAVTQTKAAAGLAASPVVCCSLATLVATGCGLRGELAGALEGVSYLIVFGIAAASLFTRATSGGQGLSDAELRAASEELAVLAAAGASDEKKRASKTKAAELASGPAGLLGLAEKACIVSAAATLIVFTAEFAATGSLPSAVPSDGVCWT